MIGVIEALDLKGLGFLSFEGKTDQAYSSKVRLDH